MLPDNASREGLIYRFVVNIAHREGNVDSAGITGDRAYILGLIREVRAAVDGPDRQPPMKFSKEAVGKI